MPQVVDVRQSSQSPAVRNCEAPLAQEDNARAGVLEAEKEEAENQAASPVAQALEAESVSHPVVSGAKDACPTNVKTSHSFGSDHPAVPMETQCTATTAEPLRQEVCVPATDDATSDAQEPSTAEACGESSTEEEHFGALDDNEDHACSENDGLEGFRLPEEMVRPDYYVSVGSRISHEGLSVLL